MRFIFFTYNIFNNKNIKYKEINSIYCRERTKQHIVLLSKNFVNDEREFCLCGALARSLVCKNIFLRYGVNYTFLLFTLFFRVSLVWVLVRYN